jgi:hypothetical protein
MGCEVTTTGKFENLAHERVSKEHMRFIITNMNTRLNEMRIENLRLKETLATRETLARSEDWETEVRLLRKSMPIDTGNKNLRQVAKHCM